MPHIYSLEQLREVITYNPFHFWGLTNSLVPVTSACESLVYEFAYQNTGAAGRADMRRALDQAVDDLKTYLEYWPGSVYTEASVEIGCFQHFDGYQNNYPTGGCSDVGAVVKLADTLVTALQTETVAALGVPVTVTPTDTDGDTLLDWFTGTFTDSTSNVALIKVAFKDSDCPMNFSFDEKLIEPVTVTRLNSTTIQISGPSWLLIPPKKYRGFSANLKNGFDPNDPSIYASSVQLYLTTISAANSVTYSYVDGSGITQTLAINATLCDGENGLIGLYLNNCAWLPCSCNQRFGQAIKVNYRSGDDINNWDQTLVHLTLAELQKKICACDEANREIYYWQMDLSLPVGPGQARISVDPATLKNPLGMRRGQIDAWNKILAGHAQRGIAV